MVKNRKKSENRKNLFFLRTTAPFFIPYSQRARRDLQLEPKIMMRNGSYGHFYTDKLVKNRKIQFLKKIYFIYRQPRPFLFVILKELAEIYN